MNPYQDINPLTPEACDGQTPILSQATRDQCLISPSNLLRPVALCVDGLLLIGEYTEKICFQVCASALILEECKFPLSGKVMEGDIA